MDKKLISVIVPIYNVERYLKRCIKSIVEQTYKELEILLIDDGSTDSSGDICDHWLEKDSRIVVYHKENGGLSDARNYGIEHATGEYIIFVDSDDVIDLHMVEILYQTACEQHVELVICDFCRNEQELFQFHKKKYETLLWSKMDALSHLYGELCVNTVVAWNKIYKKSLFGDVRFPYRRIHEDEWIIHKIFNQVDKIVYIRCPLYYYYQRENSIMNVKKTEKNLSYLDALKDRLLFFKEKNYNLVYNKTLEVFLDMNIYYSTFVCELSKEQKKMLKQDFNWYYKHQELKVPWYKRVLWFSYCYFQVMVQLTLKAVKICFFRKRHYKYY